MFCTVPSWVSASWVQALIGGITVLSSCTPGAGVPHHLGHHDFPLRCSSWMTEGPSVIRLLMRSAPVSCPDVRSRSASSPQQWVCCPAMIPYVGTLVTWHRSSRWRRGFRASRLEPVYHLHARGPCVMGSPPPHHRADPGMMVITRQQSRICCSAGVLVLQALVGYYQYLNNVPILAVAIHMVLSAIMIWAATRVCSIASR